jgi:hypothetical protein
MTDKILDGTFLGDGLAFFILVAGVLTVMFTGHWILDNLYYPWKFDRRARKEQEWYEAMRKKYHPNEKETSNDD